MGTAAIRRFDVVHQLFRLRHAKNMADTEVLAVMRTLADSVKTYEQVVEVRIAPASCRAGFV